MEIIYIRGGDTAAPGIAEAAGMKYGIRHDYKAYADVFMLDINWKRYDWLNYLAIVRDLRPVMALAPDYEYSWQWTALRRQIDDLRPLVRDVMVCPKFHGAVKHIPNDCVVAVSVPAPTYAGFLPDLNQLTGRRVHLLGGKPELQAALIAKMNAVGADVISVDGSYFAMKAGFGQMFSEGRWVQRRDRRVDDNELAAASARNVVTFLRAATATAQPSFDGW